MIYVCRLYYLGCARIAADVLLFNQTEICELAERPAKRSPEVNAAIKAQNDWAHKEVATAVTFEEDEETDGMA